MSRWSGISRFPRSSEIVLRYVSGKSGQGLDQAKINDRLSIPDIHNSNIFSFPMSEMIADQQSGMRRENRTLSILVVFPQPSHTICDTYCRIWSSRQHLGWSRNSIPRSSGIFSTYEKRTWAIVYTSVCETDTALPILLCKTNVDTSSLPELAKVNVKQSFLTLFWKMHRANNKKYQVKVLLEIEWQLNGHTIGFHPQTQKLEPHSK